MTNYTSVPRRGGAAPSCGGGPAPGAPHRPPTRAAGLQPAAVRVMWGVPPAFRAQPCCAPPGPLVPGTPLPGVRPQHLRTARSGPSPRPTSCAYLSSACCRRQRPRLWLRPGHWKKTELPCACEATAASSTNVDNVAAKRQLSLLPLNGKPRGGCSELLQSRGGASGRWMSFLTAPVCPRLSRTVRTGACLL